MNKYCFNCRCTCSHFEIGDKEQFKLHGELYESISWGCCICGHLTNASCKIRPSEPHTTFRLIHWLRRILSPKIR